MQKCIVNILEKNKLNYAEDKDTEKFWRNKKVSNFYFNSDRSWSAKIAQIVSDLNVSSVFEFGCAGGANLYAIKSKNNSIKVCGYDINDNYLSAGRKKYGINLVNGGLEDLFKVESKSFDFSFTVSVLDHIMQPAAAIKKLIDISKSYVLFIEPEYSGYPEGKIISYYFPEENKRVSALPFTYNWDIDFYIRQNSCVDLIKKEDFPLYKEYSGPYYKLFLLKIK